MPTPISPEELEMQAALAEQAALLTTVWKMMPHRWGSMMDEFGKQS
jgi:hypothetical protein